MYKYLFGPVPSRRLGISLGVDLVPYKVCNFNCVYCEVGRTTELTNKRDEYIPVTEILAELDDFLSGNPRLDFITFSGNGEPLLNSGLGEIAATIKKKYPAYPLALITNGSLFYNETVFSEIAEIDVLLPSLDAATPAVFKRINRPHPSLDIFKIIDGLVQLRSRYQGKIFLEVFILPGLNDAIPELQKLKEVIQKIEPDLVQLNTMDRPVAENWVKPASFKSLEQIARFFDPLPTEVITRSQSRESIPSFDQNVNERILQTIKRRPCTIDDLAAILNINRKEVNKYLNHLVDARKITSEQQERGIFYVPLSRDEYQKGGK